MRLQACLLGLDGRERDISRVRAAPPQRGHRGASAADGRSTSTLTTPPAVTTVVLVNRHVAQF